MGKGETWIPRDGGAQALGCFVQERRIAGRAKPVASHEFRVGERVLAMPGAAFDRRWKHGSIQCACDLPGSLVLEIEKTTHIEITLPREASALQTSVKHFQRKTPLPFRFLNCATDQEADTQT